MKGYLQRLVATVTRNEQRVFPVAGSVFSESLQEREEEVGAPRIAMGDRPQATPMVQAEAPQRSVTHGENEHPVAQPLRLLMPVRAEAPPVAQFTKRTDEASGRPANVAKEPRESVDSDEPHSATRETILPLEVRVVYAADRRTDGATSRVPVPALPAAEPAAAFAKSSPLVKPQEPAIRSAPPKTMPVRRAEEKQGHSDRGGDVEIHIGRIEVVATPSAPPRAAHAAPSRFTSLSDYLKSRNGRAG